MSLIVAARFDTFDHAAEAARKLCAEGFTEDDIHTFYINTAGEHARFPIGGDRVADPDAKGGHFGAVAGASALGLVFAPLVEREMGRLRPLDAAAACGSADDGEPGLGRRK